jgi:c-di-AMP phosphodiesterase-like protein
MGSLHTIWTYVKKYWAYAALVIAVALGYFFFHKEQIDFADQMKKINDAHDSEMKAIKDARDQEAKEHAANAAKLQATLVAVQKQYDDAKKDLDEKKKREVESLVKQYNDRPDVLAKKLSEATGFKVVMPD